MDTNHSMKNRKAFVGNRNKVSGFSGWCRVKGQIVPANDDAPEAGIVLRDTLGRNYKLIGPDHLQLDLLRHLWDLVLVSGHLNTNLMTLVIEEIQLCATNKYCLYDRERIRTIDYDRRVA